MRSEQKKEEYEEKFKKREFERNFVSSIRNLDPR